MRHATHVRKVSRRGITGVTKVAEAATLGRAEVCADLDIRSFFFFYFNGSSCAVGGDVGPKEDSDVAVCN